ncbi:MAG: hypothetical protein ACK4ZU_06905 [Allorhizobium sp.]|jgi:ElaB/YqjD/DUF883 family membrane-anchored ribosome-binding protein
MATSNLQAELRELREQMSDLKDVIGRQAGRAGYDARHRAAEAWHGAARTAGTVADYARDGADSVAGVVRRHPAATSTALITLGIIGGVIGYLVATSTPSHRDSRWRWH